MVSAAASEFVGKFFNLVQPRLYGAMSVEKALYERRSVRKYRRESLTLEELSQLLWAAQGITHDGNYRTAPSAGALYPLETYLVTGKMPDLPAGVYRYIPRGHKLAPILAGDKRPGLCRAGLHQEYIEEAPVSLVFSAVFPRMTDKYGQRGIRYVHMEVGNAAQNVALQAVSLGLGSVVIGAFDDEAVSRVLSMPPGEEPMIILPVGRKR
jgi:SagB-type dehydrogenase family enzyme